MASAPVDVKLLHSVKSDGLSQSPALSAQTLDTIQDQECSGTPLNTPWSWYLDKTVRGASAAEYEANLKKIYTFSTAEGFWSVYHNIPLVSEIQIRYSYHLMREQRRPLWEEPCNCNGGTWKIKCWKKDTVVVWRELLLASIGEQFSDYVEPGDDICGVSVSVRDRDDLIQVWNIDSSKAEKARITQKLKELCPTVDFLAIFYKAHQTRHAYEGGKHQ